jgi:hypothetical protein
LLAKFDKTGKATTLFAPGQSPAYVALAMLNLANYDPAKVNIVILPMSSLKFEGPHKIQDWFVPYLTMMVERGVAQMIRPNIAIMDDVSTGASLNVIRVFLRHVIRPWANAEFRAKIEKATANDKCAEYMRRCFTGELPGRGEDVAVEQKF